MKLSGDHHPTIVAATHKVFMREFYYIVSSSSATATGVVAPDYHNTGMAQYRITYNRDDVGGGVEEVSCEVLSCAKHLEKEEDDS